MSDKPLDFTKPVQYRNGKECRIICIDRPGTYPILSMHTNGTLNAHLANGKFYLDGTPHPYDVIQKVERIKQYHRIHEGCRSLSVAYHNIDQCNVSGIKHGTPFKQILCLTYEGDVLVGTEIIDAKKDLSRGFKVGDRVEILPFDLGGEPEKLIDAILIIRPMVEFIGLVGSIIAEGADSEWFMVGDYVYPPTLLKHAD